MAFFKRQGWAVLWAAVAVLAAWSAGWATPEWDPQDVSVDGKHVGILITCKDYNSVDSLYYRSLLANLDDFADSLKRTGKLNRGKIRIALFSTTHHWRVHTEVTMYRYKSGYYCRLYSVGGQDYLTKVIAYFASDNWESFCINDDAEIEPGVAQGILDRRINAITVTHKYAPRKVLDAGNGIAVYFENDALICKGANKVYGKVGAMLPFSIGSKTFITDRDAISVVENGTVINEYKTEGLELDNVSDCVSCDGPYKEVFPGWVNIKNSYDYVLSYSIAKNKFYGQEIIEKQRAKQKERDIERGKEYTEKNSSYFTDSRDDHKYRAVTINGKTWMAQNLNYRTDSSWCYENDSSNCVKYGKLYDWNTAKTVCPSDWYLPTIEEWNDLVTATGGDAASRALKSKIRWNGVDRYGFSALPGGIRKADGKFDNVYSCGDWWTATEIDSGKAYFQHMFSPQDMVFVFSERKGNGYSVRCVQNAR